LQTSFDFDFYSFLVAMLLRLSQLKNVPVSLIEQDFRTLDLVFAKLRFLSMQYANNTTYLVISKEKLNWQVELKKM